MLPGVEEVIVNTGVRLAAQSAVASVKSAGRKKSITEVLVTDLGEEPELNELTNVVNLHLSRGAQWESCLDIGLAMAAAITSPPRRLSLAPPCR